MSTMQGSRCRLANQDLQGAGTLLTQIAGDRRTAAQPRGPSVLRFRSGLAASTFCHPYSLVQENRTHEDQSSFAA